MSAPSQSQIDRSAAWVGVASLVLGVLDLVSNLICLQLWTTTADFGAATLAIALFPILERLGGTPLVNVVIRHDEPDARYQATITWLALACSAVLTGLLALGRPVIADLFPQPITATLLIAYGGALVIRQLSIIPEAQMKRALRYREVSFVRMAAQAADTIVKLGVAYLGAHVNHDLLIWCFALGPIANVVVMTVGLQVCQPVRPQLAFDRGPALAAIREGAAIAGGELLYFFYTSTDYLVVGRVFGDAAVGAYRLAYELVLDVVRLVSMVTADVALPTFARLAGHADQLGSQLLRFTRQNLIAIAPFLVFVLVEADDLLALLYPPLPPEVAMAARVLCVVGGARTLGFVLPPLLIGVGRASRVLLYNGVASVLLPACFIIAATVGTDIVAVAWGWGIGYPIAFALLVIMTLGAAQLSLGRYVRAIAGILTCATAATFVGALVRAALPAEPWLRAAGVAGAVLATYLLLLWPVERVTPALIVRSFRS